MVTLNLRLRSSPVLKFILEIWSYCWPVGAEGGLSACRGCLRRFLLVKLAAALLFPQGAGLPLLVSCLFSLRASLLLRSPHISTKPSTVLLGQLALSDALAALQWALRAGGWTLMTKGGWAEWSGAARALCRQLLDAHHLASLLLLGLLGLEATLVSRWPRQTRRFRTSHAAQLSCSLVWMFVLLEFVFMLYPKFLQQSGAQTDPSVKGFHSSPLGYVPPRPLPALSLCLRRILWLGNSWLHYDVFYSQPQKRKSSYH